MGETTRESFVTTYVTLRYDVDEDGSMVYGNTTIEVHETGETFELPTMALIEFVAATYVHGRLTDVINRAHPVQLLNALPALLVG